MSDVRGAQGGRGDDEDDALMARLLRASGPRAEAAPDRTARVRRAVLDEWRILAHRRRTQRRAAMVAALLAVAATAVLLVSVQSSSTDRTPVAREVVASVERLGSGPVRLLDDSATGLAEARMAPASVARAGDRIETGNAGHVALRLASGAVLRIDADTRLRLASVSRIDLERGAVYVDTGRDGTPPIEIHTPLGVARDVGTQFETRLESSTLTIRVRSGLVELRRGDAVVPARPGVELAVSPTGVSSRAIPTYGAEWDWIATLAPPLEIDGRPLAGFLEGLCREQGWTLHYADASLAREASGIVLRGSVAGLAPEEALGVALATSGLSHRLNEGTLEVSRAKGAKKKSGALSAS